MDSLPDSSKLSKQQFYITVAILLLINFYSIWSNYSGTRETIASEQLRTLYLKCQEQVEKNEALAQQREKEYQNLFQLSVNQQLEINKLKWDMYLMDSQVRSKPVAEWSKNLQFEITWINHEYVRLFLTPRGFEATDYIGAKDNKVWGDDIASMFVENDKKILATGKPDVFVVYVPRVTRHGQWELIVIKYPLRDETGAITGIGGMAMVKNRDD